MEIEVSISGGFKATTQAYKVGRLLLRNRLFHLRFRINIFNSRTAGEAKAISERRLSESEEWIKLLCSYGYENNPRR